MTKPNYEQLEARLEMVGELAGISEQLHEEAQKACEAQAEELAAARQQIEALAAENAVIRKHSEAVYAAGYNHGHLNTVDGIAYADCVKDDFYGLALQILAEPETPATDAALNEIRAQGVERFATHLRSNGSISSPCWMFAVGADEFAAQLRGEVSR